MPAPTPSILILTLLVALAALAGCKTLDGGSGSGSSSNLSGYSTYSWLPPDREKLPSRFGPAELMQPDIQRVTDIHLSNAQLKRVPPGNGQLLVRYRIGVGRNVPGRTAGNFGTSMDVTGSSFFSAGSGPESPTAAPTETGILEIELLNAASRKRLWRNSAAFTLSSSSGEQASLNGAIQEIFFDFPR